MLLGDDNGRDPKTLKRSLPLALPLFSQTSLNKIHTRRMSREMDSRFLVLSLSVSWPSCKRLTEATCKGSICKEADFYGGQNRTASGYRKLRKDQGGELRRARLFLKTRDEKSGKSPRFQKHTLPTNQLESHWPASADNRSLLRCWKRGCKGQGKNLEQKLLMLCARRLMSFFPRQPPDTSVIRLFTADSLPNQSQSWASDSDTVLLVFSSCQLPSGCHLHSLPGPNRSKREDKM
jgi:hypothetical protein